MRVDVLYFAAAREKAGISKEALELPEGVRTPADLRALLVERHPALAPLWPHLRIAVDRAMVPSDAPLHEGAEVALIPPVSGGEGFFRVVDRPISAEEVIAEVAAKGCGGVVTFLGTVRDLTGGREVTLLEYEAYIPMAEAVISRLAAEIVERLPDVRLAVLHRVGALEPGEIAVVVAAAAPHRKEAFLACEEAIAKLKAEAPIWKKEHGPNGAIWVESCGS